MGQRVRSAYVNVVERKALEENRYQVTIAANEGVRQPPDLDFDGMATENYERNPVVMWAHDVVGRSPSGGLPVGRTLRLDKAADGRMVADFEFLSDDPFAQRVKNAWDKGFLRAASVSWIPVESAPGEGGRWRDTRSDLLEWSIVAVPADPDALRESHRRLLDEFLGDEVELDVNSGEGIWAEELVEIRRLVSDVRSRLEAGVLGMLRPRRGGRIAMRPYEGRDQRDGRTRHPAGESREGTALFGGGLGVTPQPLLAPLPAREASGDGRTAVRSYENGERIDGHTYLGGHDAEYGR